MRDNVYLGINKFLQQKRNCNSCIFFFLRKYKRNCSIINPCIYDIYKENNNN